MSELTEEEKEVCEMLWREFHYGLEEQEVQNER